MTITDRDIRDQVQHAIDASEGVYDIATITRAIVQRWGRVDINDIDHDEFWALVGEHVVPDEDTMTTAITTADQWADALDAATTKDVSVGELVSFAYADGSICGVGIDITADDDTCRQLTSADGCWVIRYRAQDGFWTADSNDGCEGHDGENGADVYCDGSCRAAGRRSVA